MEFVKKNFLGFLLCLVIAVPSHFLGKMYPIVGGAVFGILIGMVVTLFIKNKGPFKDGIGFTSKKILQYAVVLLGFGLNISVVLETGKQSLPIIVCTITVALMLAYVLHKILNIPGKISTLVGVGSSICGGSAIAATAPVIQAEDDEVAQAISVVFFFNVLAALVFPWLGTMLGFSTTSGEAFGIFAGTAVNDTSSVTATAATWDAMHNLGSATLDKAVTVKLTRTLAIIPIVMVLGIMQGKKNKGGSQKIKIQNILPMFIIWFIVASLITTVAVHFGVATEVFAPFKALSKFFIILAMSAIGLNTDIVKLVKSSGKPLFMGFCCWVGITATSLLLQHVLGLW